MIFKITNPDGSTNEIIANLEFVQANFNSWEIITETVPEPVILPKIISKYQFLSRFTNPELEAIYIAAKTNVALEVYLAKINAAQEIDLQSPELINGVNSLELLGFLSTGRAAEILT